MPVRPDPDQSGVDPVLEAAVQQLRSEYSGRVRAIAKNWSDGLKGVLGLTGVAGLAGAPLAASTLSDTSKNIIGALIVLVFISSVSGLIFLTAASSGTIKRYRAPASIAGLILTQRRIADRASAYLRYGRTLAIGSIVGLAAAIGVAWIDPWHGNGELVRIEAASIELCGEFSQSPKGYVTIRSEGAHIARLAIADIESISIVDSCTAAN